LNIRKKSYSPVYVERRVLTLCYGWELGANKKLHLLEQKILKFTHSGEHKAITLLALILLQPQMLNSLAGKYLYLRKESKAVEEAFYMARKVKL